MHKLTHTHTTRSHVLVRVKYSCHDCNGDFDVFSWKNVNDPHSVATSSE